MKITINDDEIANLKALTPTQKLKAFKLAAAFMINSTNVGYMKRVDPEGKKWAENPEWWQKMKGQATPLTGATSKKIKKESNFSKYLEFENINKERMKNCLISKCTTTYAKIEYKKSAKKRAAINQHGGQGIMRMKHKKTGKIIDFNIDVQKRVHLGVADKHHRVGNKNDVEHIAGIFADVVMNGLK